MLTDRPGIPHAALTPGPGLYPGGHLKPVLIIYLPHVGFTPKPELVCAHCSTFAWFDVKNAGWDCWDVIFSALTDVLCSYVVGVGWLDHISHGLPAPLLFMQPYRRVRFSCDAGPKESPINVSLGYTNTPWRWVNLRGNQGSDMWMECGYQ